MAEPLPLVAEAAADETATDAAVTTSTSSGTAKVARTTSFISARPTAFPSSSGVPPTIRPR
jgi:hypothetical protein